MAASNNINRNAECHVLQPSPYFWVRATRNIQGRKRLISPGEHVLIDPTGEPREGSLVLVGGTLKQWHERDRIGYLEGVAVQIYSDAV